MGMEQVAPWENLINNTMITIQIVSGSLLIFLLILTIIKKVQHKKIIIIFMILLAIIFVISVFSDVIPVFLVNICRKIYGY